VIGLVKVLTVCNVMSRNVPSVCALHCYRTEFNVPSPPLVANVLLVVTNGARCCEAANDPYGKILTPYQQSINTVIALQVARV